MMTGVGVRGRKEADPPPLFTECRAWRPQISRLWKDIGKAHGWKHPRVPSVRWLWGNKSAEAILVFLGGTGVGCAGTGRKPLGDVVGWGRVMRWGEGGRARQICNFFCPLYFGDERIDHFGLGQDMVMLKKSRRCLWPFGPHVAV